MRDRTSSGMTAYRALARVCPRCGERARELTGSSPEQSNDAGEAAIRICMACEKPCADGRNVISLYRDPLEGFRAVQKVGCSKYEITMLYAHLSDGAVSGPRAMLELLDTPHHRLTVMRNGRVFALAPDPRGEYSVMSHSNGARMRKYFAMACRELVKTLLREFAAPNATKVRLPAWVEDGILFFGEAGKR